MSIGGPHEVLPSHGRRRGAHVALTEQRRLFLTRGHSLISELAAA